MKKFVYFAVGMVTMLMATSCEKDVSNSTSGEGGFSLSLNVSEAITTRTETTEQDPVSNARVNIYMPASAGLIRSYTFGTMPDVVYLPVGDGYRVDVIAGEAAEEAPRKATFEQKSYKGSQEFNIKKNEVTEDIKVTAYVCNAIVNANFNQTISENLTDYSVKFSLSEDFLEGETLTYDSETVKNGPVDGYFIIDNLLTQTNIYWEFTGKLKDSSKTPFLANGVIEATTDSDHDKNLDLAGVRQQLTFKYEVKDGTLSFNLVVDKSTVSTNDQIMWTPTSTGITAPETSDIWATFVNIKADVDTDDYDPEKVYIQYRKPGAEEWSQSEPATILSDGVFGTTIMDLDPATAYESRLVVWTNAPDGAESEMVEIEGITNFTTAKAQQVPNASFEQYYNTGKYDVFNPQSGYGFTTAIHSSDPGNLHTWWGTGNQSTDLAVAEVTVDVTSISDEVPHQTNNKSSVCMKSKNPGKFAAGNIYSGYFAGLQGMNGTVYFGRDKCANGDKFESRPTGVSFYVKYNSCKITKTGGDFTSTSQYDEGQVKVAIGKWKKYGGVTECPIAVNTADSENPPAHWNLASLDDTIVYEDMIFDSSYNDKGWVKVILKFDYTKTTKPSHIIISAASSRCGDYFAGGEGSTMYLDDIKLLYDHPSLFDEGIFESSAVQYAPDYCN